MALLPKMTAQEVLRRMEAGTIRLVDIREPEEVAALRIPGAEVAPLSVIRWAALPASREDRPVVFCCRSGRRTSDGSVLLAEVAGGPAWQMEGGVNAWVQANLPVERGKKTISLQRQMQIGAGTLSLLGLLGSLAWPPALWLTAFVAAGLTVAGVTGFCGLGLLLKRMPWNR